MRKNLFLISGITGCVAGIVGITFLFIGKQDVYMISMAITAVLASVFLVLDPDNNNQKRRATPLVILSTLAIVIMLLIGLSSCGGSKYGCGHGAPRQSWNKMVNRINSPK
jgi:O-antigen/teichoic acid export membrane protein